MAWCSYGLVWCTLLDAKQLLTKEQDLAWKHWNVEMKTFNTCPYDLHLSSLCVFVRGWYTFMQLLFPAGPLFGGQAGWCVVISSAVA